jgi:diketogulonate reductase-like aldo/keto reductase
LPQAQDQPPPSSPAAAAAAAKPDADSVVLRGGARMPLLGLGTYALDSPDAVRAALAAGYRHVDCAPIYGNEAVVGQGLAERLAAEGGRASLWLTSKIWNDAHRPEAAAASARASVAALGCGYLDLLLVHWPHAWVPGGGEAPDAGVTLRDTWQALEALVDSGLVRHLGVSNFSLRQVEEVLAFARVKPVVSQVEGHPLLAQRKLVGVCLRKGVHTVAYSPLAHSHSLPDHSDHSLLEHPEVAAVAAAAGRTPAQVLLRWNVQRGVGVLPKAGSAAHARENAEGLFAWRLTWDQKARLDALDEGRRFVSPAWHAWDDAEEGGAVKPSRVLLGGQA